MPVKKVFREDPYLAERTTVVIHVNDNLITLASTGKSGLRFIWYEM
jgi:Ser-tRNA(Ala) deacylase AlaX